MKDPRHARSHPPALEKPRVRAIDAEADRSGAEAAVDGIGHPGQPLAAARQAGGGGQEQISGPVSQVDHLAQVHPEREDPAGADLPRHPLPQLAIEAEEKRRVRCRHGTDRARPPDPVHRLDHQRQAPRHPAVTAHAGRGLAEQPATHQPCLARDAAFGGKYLAVAIAMPPGRQEGDVLALQGPDEALALDGTPDQPGMARIEVMERLDGEDPGAFKPPADPPGNPGQVPQAQLRQPPGHVVAVEPLKTVGLLQLAGDLGQKVVGADPRREPDGRADLGPHARAHPLDQGARALHGGGRAGQAQLELVDRADALELGHLVEDVGQAQVVAHVKAVARGAEDDARHHAAGLGDGGAGAHALRLGLDGGGNADAVPALDGGNGDGPATQRG